MQRDAVENALRQYRHNKGRYEFLGAEIENLNYEIRLGVVNIVADEAAIGAQVISDMPHGTKVGNPTEEKGIKLADGWEPQYIKDMRAQVKAHEDERSRLLISIHFVDAWMQGLSERDAWIIKAWYIDAECFERISEMYKREFQCEVNTKTIRRYRTAAFEKICKMAE